MIILKKMANIKMNSVSGDFAVILFYGIGIFLTVVYFGLGIEGNVESSPRIVNKISLAQCNTKRKGILIRTAF